MANWWTINSYSFTKSDRRRTIVTLRKYLKEKEERTFTYQPHCSHHLLYRADIRVYSQTLVLQCFTLAWRWLRCKTRRAFPLAWTQSHSFCSEWVLLVEPVPSQGPQIHGCCSYQRTALEKKDSAAVTDMHLYINTTNYSESLKT